jgi:hypothetical protein
MLFAQDVAHVDRCSRLEFGRSHSADNICVLVCFETKCFRICDENMRCELILLSTRARFIQLYTLQSSYAGVVGRTTELPRERGRAVSFFGA